DLCWALSFGAEYHQGVDDCEARHRDPLAPCRFQIVLALEIAATLRSTDGTVGNLPADPRDEHRHPLWGAPRLHGELLKFGINIGKTSVAKYMARRRALPRRDGRRSFNRAEGFA